MEKMDIIIIFLVTIIIFQLLFVDQKIKENREYNHCDSCLIMNRVIIPENYTGFYIDDWMGYYGNCDEIIIKKPNYEYFIGREVKCDWKGFPA